MLPFQLCLSIFLHHFGKLLDSWIVDVRMYVCMYVRTCIGVTTFNFVFSSLNMVMSGL